MQRGFFSVPHRFATLAARRTEIAFLPRMGLIYRKGQNLVQQPQKSEYACNVGSARAIILPRTKLYYGSVRGNDREMASAVQRRELNCWDPLFIVAAQREEDHDKQKLLSRSGPVSVYNNAAADDDVLHNTAERVRFRHQRHTTDRPTT